MPKRLTIISATILMVVTVMPAAAQEATALIGATIIDGTGGPAIENGTVLIEGDRIACVGAAGDCAVPGGAETRDLAGHFITPGLIDAHVHFAQTGWHDGRPDGIDAPEVYPYHETVAALRNDPGRWHRAYLCSGVTAVFDVGGAPWTVTDPHATDTDRADRVHVRAAGPLVTHAHSRNAVYTRRTPDQPMFFSMDSDDEVREAVRRLKEMGSDAVKVWFLPPSEERRAELDARVHLIGQLAREAGLPMIVHATGLREAKVALEAGADMLVHSVFDRPVDQEFIDLLLENDAVYAPTLIAALGWDKALAAVAFKTPLEIDDPNNCVDKAILERINTPERLADPAGDRFTPAGAVAQLVDAGRELEILAANLRTVAEAGGHIVLATDAGNPLTLHGPSVNWEMEEMQRAGLAPEQIIVAATLKGAQAMGLEDEIGTLEEGKTADLIVLSDDPREDVAHFRALTHVMRKGVLKAQSALRVR